MTDLDESTASEITILPDGRVYAFGITGQIMEILEALQSREAALHQAAKKTIASDDVSLRSLTDG